MRRTQSHRHQARPSFSDRSYVPEDLSVLHEQADESPEDTLRRQLLAKERENDKLQAHLLSLQDQLSQRPPLEHIQELEREYKNLELLLQGTQRENERCMAELERGKNREKMLERELAKLAGENWQTSLNIAPSTTSALRGVFGSTARSMPLSEGASSHHDPKESAAGDSTVSATASNSGTTLSNATAANVEATRVHLERVRLLVIGLDQRLQTREEKFDKAVERAEAASARVASLSV